MNEQLRQLEWGTVSAERWLRSGRYGLGPGKRMGDPHYHDFVEFFWVEAGHGEHEVNGRREPLVPGDVNFLRATDQHTINNPHATDLVWTNVTVRADAEQRLRDRYADALGWWPWHDQHQQHVRKDQLVQLQEWVLSMPMSQPRELDQEWFIINVLRLLDTQERRRADGGVPEWLESSLYSFSHQSTLLQEGVPALVRLCGRCPEHVNRVVRQHRGMTVTELVRQFRLEHAARDLRLSRKSILEVALDAGFDNLSYFYRCFRQHYGMTPRHFRLQVH